MAQQTSTTTTKQTTIIEDLQFVSFKILELSEKYKLPENDVIEINDSLLEIYKKVKKSTIYPTQPEEPQGPPPPLNQENQANLTYTYTYTFNNNENDLSEEEQEEEPEGEYYDYTPRGKITTSITSTTISPASSELIDVEYFNSNPRRL